MKILVCKAYGGYGLSDEFLKAHPQFDGDEFDYDSKRDNEDLIKAVEAFGLEKAQSKYCDLTVVTIPDEVTDWEIVENDGWEDIVYVVDGKLKWA